MDRREFLALAASVPLLTGTASADIDSTPAPAETDGATTAQDGAETVEIDVRIR